MSYTLSIPLKMNINKSELIEKFQCPYPEYINYIDINDNYELNDYSEKIKNGIFLNYKVLPTDINYYLNFFASMSAYLYGLKKICKINNKSYPYYYYDSKLTYVIPTKDINDFNDYLFYDKFDIFIIKEIEEIDIYKNIDKKKFNLKLEEFKDFFGDNELLKINCSKLLNRLNLH